MSKVNVVPQYVEDFDVDPPEPTEGLYYLTGNGNLWLINFGVGKTNLQPAHIKIIDKYLLPYVVKVITKVGVKDWQMKVRGQASATGNHDNNSDLSSGRASAAFRHLEMVFKAEQKKNPALTGVTLTPTIESFGDELSVKEAETVLGLKTRADIQNNRGLVERAQLHRRSAIFLLRTALEVPSGVGVYGIREIYLFKFKKIEEPLPQAVKELQDILDNPKVGIGLKVVQFLLKKLNVLKPLFEVLGAPEFLAAQHFIGFMIPDDADYCYEVKNVRDVHALYRWHGLVHNDSFGIMELLGFLVKLASVAKAVAALVSSVGTLGKIATALNKATEEVIDKAADFLRPHLGDEVTDTLKKWLLDLKNGVDFEMDAVTAPTSAWVRFTFYDNSASRLVTSLAGAAKRTSVDIAFGSVVDLDFGGPVSTNPLEFDSRFMAHAKITAPFSIKNSLFGQSMGDGALLLLKGPYNGDLAVGPQNLVNG
jgi:hypothetical protein